MDDGWKTILSFPFGAFRPILRVRTVSLPGCKSLIKKHSHFPDIHEIKHDLSKCYSMTAIFFRIEDWSIALHIFEDLGGAASPAVIASPWRQGLHVLRRCHGDVVGHNAVLSSISSAGRWKDTWHPFFGCGGSLGFFISKF